MRLAAVVVSCVKVRGVARVSGVAVIMAVECVTRTGAIIGSLVASGHVLLPLIS